VIVDLMMNRLLREKFPSSPPQQVEPTIIPPKYHTIQKRKQ
jgi:hypothetical protein